VEETSTHMNEYIAKLKLFSESEERGIEDIENEIRDGLGVSKIKLKEIKGGSLRVEVHYTINKDKSRKCSLLIFDHDYLVAYVHLRKYIKKTLMESSNTRTFVKGGGYVQRAIELLLTSEIIMEWHSDSNMLSPYANKMYDRIAEKDKFVVEKIGGNSFFQRKVYLR